MKEQLKNLWNLQKLDNKIQEIEKEKEKIPQEIENAKKIIKEKEKVKAGETVAIINQRI